MEVVLHPTVREIIQQARIRAEMAQRALIIKRVKLAAAKTRAEKAAARAVRLRARAFREAIR